MKHITSLRHIAGLYLDLYSQPRDLRRPLTPEQVQEAGRFFLDLITAHEAELLIEQQRRAQAALPSYQQIADMFAERYRKENGLDGALNDHAWSHATEIFLSYLSGSFDVEADHDTLIS